jgi:hypothetical protein
MCPPRPSYGADGAASIFLANIPLLRPKRAEDPLTQHPTAAYALQSADLVDSLSSTPMRRDPGFWPRTGLSSGPAAGLPAR